MQSPQLFSDASQRRKNTFTHDDITNVIFSDIHPLHTFHPFRSLRKFSRKRDAVTIKVKLFDIPLKSYQLVKEIFYSLGSTLITDPHMIPAWMVPTVVKQYNEISEDWFEYLSSELQNYCENNLQSKMQWSAFSRGIPVLGSEVSVEKKLWIYINEDFSKALDRKFLYELKESLLPWLNTEMYSAMKKKQDNTRTNADYEHQRQEMFEAAQKFEKELATSGRKPTFPEELDTIE